MLHRVVARCAPALRARCAAAAPQRGVQHLRKASRALPSLQTLSASFQGRHFCSHKDKSANANATTTAASVSADAGEPTQGEAAYAGGAPGVESEGEKFVMVYTCAVCETRSAKTISKHAYYKGVVLVRCPGCENLHLVADRLGWFEDGGTDVETLLKAKGESVRFVTGENVLELTENDIIGDVKPREE